VACRIGNGVLRQLRATSKAFQGTVIENTWRVALDGGDYDPKLGHGRVLMGEDGTPAALIWSMVDDFLIHAPTRSKCVTAFNDFMDMTVRLGFICQKVKSSPPAQVQKFCGFLYDTSEEPTLLIPDAKISRAQATLTYLQTLGHRPLSRLALAVAVGLLQSLVDATPQRIGQTYLRLVYDDLHALADPNRTLGRGLYYTTITLSDDAWADLTWWSTYLTLNSGARGRSSTSGSLTATWGDGSGTGTGGTLEEAGTTGKIPVIEAWMGTWEFHVHVFSSNWRELRTLLHTLERILRDRGPIHATLFYFTDNLVTYYIVQSGSSCSLELHRLIRRIKEIELQLSIRLEVMDAGDANVLVVKICQPIITSGMLSTERPSRLFVCNA
jgi:hypothetical protein